MNLATLKQKIVLGTVQLGLPYGINNSSGKPSEQESFDILDLAFENNISTLDSADAYGEANDIIGRYFKTSGKDFKVINKFVVDEMPLIDKLRLFLTKTNSKSIKCYMYHRFSDYEQKLVAKSLRDLKHQGLTEKVGVSLYSNDQLRIAVNDPEIDIIQLPVNILDLNKEKRSLLVEAKGNGKEIHARSVFLQGLFLKDPETLTGNLMQLAPYLRKLRAVTQMYELDLKRTALNFVLHQDFIDHVLVGVEQKWQLMENLSLIDETFQNGLFADFEVDNNDAFLLSPTNWKP